MMVRWKGLLTLEQVERLVQIDCGRTIRVRQDLCENSTHSEGVEMVLDRGSSQFDLPDL